MNRIYFIIFFIATISITSFVKSQNNTTQVVRGKVTDKDSRTTIPGVNIVIQKNGKTLFGQSTDKNGYYRTAPTLLAMEI